MIPPSMPTSLYLFVAATVVIGSCFGWAWGVAGMAAALRARDQDRLQQQEEALIPTYVMHTLTLLIKASTIRQAPLCKVSREHGSCRTERQFSEPSFMAIFLIRDQPQCLESSSSLVLGYSVSSEPISRDCESQNDRDSAFTKARVIACVFGTIMLDGKMH